VVTPTPEEVCVAIKKVEYREVTVHRTITGIRKIILPSMACGTSLYGSTTTSVTMTMLSWVDMPTRKNP